jgi:hypothetical protein
MDWEIVVRYFLYSFTLIGEIAILLFLIFGESYTQQKGVNLATKEDIEEITKRIEKTKKDFTEDLERFKSILAVEMEYAKFIAAVRFETFNKIGELKKDIFLAFNSKTTGEGEGIELGKAVLKLQAYIKGRFAILLDFRSELEIVNDAFEKENLLIGEWIKDKENVKKFQICRDGMDAVMDALNILQGAMIRKKMDHV